MVYVASDSDREELIMENFAESQVDEQHIQPIMETASTGRRFWAFIIDHIIITIIVLVPSFMFGPINFFGIMLAASFLYAIKDIVKGRSPGKFVLGIAVRNQADASETPSAAKLFLRNVLSFLWPVEFIVLLSSKTKIGDKLAKTNVYRLPKKMKPIIKLAIVLACVAPLILLMQLGIGSRTPLTAEEFTSRMEEAGFVVEDITYQFVEYDSIESVFSVRTEFFRIDFAVLSSNSHAQQMFNAIRNNIEAASRGMMSSQTSISVPSFSRFAISVGGHYAVVSRIENTIVAAESSSADRAAMNENLCSKNLTICRYIPYKEK